MFSAANERVKRGELVRANEVELLLEVMQDVLRWDASDEKEVRRVEQAFAAKVAEALGHSLARAADDDAAGVASAVASLREASPVSVIRIFFAPETTTRLLFPMRSETEGCVAFLTRSFLAEAARCGDVFTVAEPTWTPLGDFGVIPPRTIVSSPVIDVLPPLDLGSPYALSIDPIGTQARVARSCRSLRGTARQRVIELLKDAGSGITHASPEAHQFVMRFVRTLVVLQDSRARFGSSSRADYVGRAVLRSVDWSRVDELDCAEGIVHEAIHALLSMGMLVEPWVIDDVAAASKPLLVSPWTGNSIAFDAFVHACFVWFGLLNFWAIALSRGPFPQQRVLARIRRAGRGFEGTDLAESLAASHEDVLAPTVGRVIGQMQEVARGLAQATTQ